MTKWTEAIWLLPTEPRCLAHGIKPEGPFKSEWCELRGECARHVAIAGDPPDARIVLHPRLCAVGEFDWLLPMAPLEEGD